MESVVISTSLDGTHFSVLGTIINDFPNNSFGSFVKDFMFTCNQKIRYLKVVAINPGVCPEWHSGNGHKSWMMFDEITIEQPNQ